MEQIIVAAIGATGLVGAAFVTARITSKINTATQRADVNTTRAEVVVEALWAKIDRLQVDNDMLRRQLKMCIESKE
jgi:hypothetical protein